MADLNDLIKYEKEYTALDFKYIQYNKGMHEDLIKDIMSMANADIEGDRYIVVGVKYKNSNDKDIIGIDKDEFIDSSIYQQLIGENVEPQIIFDYFAHDYEGKCLGIFKIMQCNNQPYMMKKDKGNLKKGDAFIRKGDSQMKLIREDLDKIFAKRFEGEKFNDKIKIYFAGSAESQEIELATIGDFELPSERAREKSKRSLN